MNRHFAYLKYKDDHQEFAWCVHSWPAKSIHTHWQIWHHKSYSKWIYTISLAKLLLVQSMLTTQCSSNDWREREKIEAIYIYSESGGYVPSHQSLLSSWWYVITIKPRSECTESCRRIGGQKYLTNLSPGGGWGPARTQRYKLPEIFEEDLLTIPDICHFFYTSRF